VYAGYVLCGMYRLTVYELSMYICCIYLYAAMVVWYGVPGVYGRVCMCRTLCVLCHVLVVYSLSVLEWLGCLSYACR
jgi:hypothetical protein